MGDVPWGRPSVGGRRANPHSPDRAAAWRGDPGWPRNGRSTTPGASPLPTLSRCRLVTASPIHLAGERLMLDPLGALVWPAAGLLAVSDLHLEKGTSFARKG